MHDPKRGHAAAAGIFTGVMLVFGACGSNPPPSPTHPLSVAGVYFCAVSQLNLEGYELVQERQVSEPEFRFGYLRRGESMSTVTIAVRQTDRGEIHVQVAMGFMRSRAWENQMEERIRGVCMS